MKSKIICLIIFFNMVTMNLASAFFLHNDRSNYLRIEHTPIDLPTQDNNRLYLYDNFLSSSSESYLSRKKEHFIFADQIKINIPINILRQESIYPENSIDRMMLANLRAKKLYDEYAELQKKARLAVQENWPSGRGKERGKNPIHHNENIDIDQKNEEIQKAISHVNFLGQNFKDTESDESPIHLEHLSSVNNELNTSEKSRIYAISQGDDSIRGSGTATPKQQGLSRKQSSELPWILNGLLKLLNYIVNNRLEIMLYTIFIAMIVVLISLRLKR